MKLVTKEFTLELLKNNTIVQKVKDGCLELTEEGAIEVMEKLDELILLNSPSTKMIVYMPAFYVNKKVIKHLTGTMQPSMAFVALIASGYISKYIASIAIKIQERFRQGDDNQVATKVFMKVDMATKWLSSV